LAGRHDGGRHGPDLDANAARQVEPVRLGREVEDKRRIPHGQTGVAEEDWIR
jgi:hypothetical protein